MTKVLEMYETYFLQQYLQNFEAVLAAEFGLLNLYVVSEVGNYNMTNLIYFGEKCFPDGLVAKAPEAILDVRQATQCIAYALPTAAGFHLHRANESVLHRYYDAVTGGAPRPSTRNIGDYLKALDDRGAGDSRVKSALRDLKNLHRNPLIHPEHSLESVDDAVALMGGVHVAMLHMLKTMPDVPSPVAAAISGAVAITVGSGAPTTAISIVSGPSFPPPSSSGQQP